MIKVQAIIKQRDETGTISAEQANNLIEAAKHQKEVTVNQAQGMHEQIVMEAQKQAGEHVNKVDWETGQIKSKWQVLKDDVSKKASDTWENVQKAFSEKKESVIKTANETVEGIKEKWEKAKKEAKTWGSDVAEKLREGLDSKKESIKAKAEELKEKVKAGLSGLREDLKTLGKHAADGLAKGLEFVKSVKESAQKLAQTAVESVKSKLDIHSPSRVMQELGKYASQGLALGILEDMDKVEKASRLAAQTVKDITEGKLSDVKIKTNTNDKEINSRIANQLNLGASNKNEYQKYLNFVDKLNKEEVEKSKERLKEDYENRVKYLDNRLRIVKNENSMELQNEKARIDAQISYYQNLSRNTKNKDEKKNYANEIANLRQYQKEILNVNKSNQKAQVESLERSKRALKEYYDDGMNLLDKREKDVKKSLKLQENVFKDLMTTYDTAIKQLSIKTGDLIKDLENQEAIVVVQSKS